MRDHLSEVLDVVAVRGVISGSARVARPWRARAANTEPLKFCAIARGAATLRTDGIDEPIRLEQGAVALLNGRAWLTLQAGDDQAAAIEVPQPVDGEMVRLDGDDADASDVFIGGRIELDDAGQQLLAVLPPVTHIPSSSAAAARMRDQLQHIFEEVSAGLPGSQFAVRQYAHLLVLDALRVVAEMPGLPPGWLRLLADPQLRPALDLMHAEPGLNRDLTELAHATAMSRTMFATRFREAAGIPPISYLTQWRMLLARRQLRGAQTRIRPLALQLGYSSESAFSSAFKRQVGVSPQGYRKRFLAGASV